MNPESTRRHRVRDVLPVVVGVGLGVLLVFPPVRLGALALAVAGACALAYRAGHRLVALLAVAFLLRLVTLAVDTQLGVVIVTGTAIENHEAAAAFVDGLLAGGLDVPSDTRQVVMAVFHAPFYLILGDGYTVGAISTAFYGSLVGVPAYYIARRIVEPRTALLATGAVVLWPSLFLRSLVVQREVFIVLVLFVILLVAVRWVERPRLADLGLALPAIWLLLQLRRENLLLVAVVGFLVILARSDFDWVQVLLLGAGGGVVAIFALNFGQFTNYGDVVTPAVIDQFAHGRAKGNAAYLTDLHYRTWLDVALLAPVKFVYYTFSPLPWQVTRPVDLLAGLSGWGVFLSCLLVPRAIRQHPNRRRELLVLLGYAVSGLTLYGIVELNYGAAFRRRIAFVPILVMIAVFALARVTVRYRSDATHETQPTS